MVPGDTFAMTAEEHKASKACADETKVSCVIRDMTDFECSNSITLLLPGSTLPYELIHEVALKYGYEPDSFNLTYDCPSEAVSDAIVVNNLGDKPLKDFCYVVGQDKRNNFTIMDKDGDMPRRTKEKPTSKQGSGDSGDVNLDSLNLGQSEASASTSTSTTGSFVSPEFTFASAILRSDTGFVGLVNQAMTCYLNSLLQTLYMTPEFRNALYRWEYDGDDNSRERSIPYQLQRLFLLMQTSKKRAVETTDLTKSFGWDSSEAWQQHDVQELCRVMFDALEVTWKNTDQAHLINKLYQGKIKDYVKCLECSYESSKTDVYLDIPLPIRPFGSTKAFGSVIEALNAFIQPETLDGTNQYFCEKCNKKCNAHKGLRFTSFPYLLTVQLKRFDFDYATLQRIKLNDKMTFPDVLDLNHLIDDMELEDSGGGGDNDNPMEIDDVSDEGIDMDNSISGASAPNSETSSVSSEAAANDKNAREMKSKGPYVYELFSIMIHSGNATGGHYYAYIKSFKDGHWYSFNDQHVTRITYDDIRKTYGGCSSSGRGYYSSMYMSSTNAYMLMYRQIDKERNADFLPIDKCPPHIKRELTRIQNQEEAEKRQKEIDRSTCKIKLFCDHPVKRGRIDIRFEVHKDKTLRKATEMAYKLCELEGILPLEDVRLVKYDDFHDSLEKSYEGDEETPMNVILGGVKAVYTFDLLLEIRQPGQTFQTYQPGGVTCRIHNVDVTHEEIANPVVVRAFLSQTVVEFRRLVSEVAGLPEEHMRIVLEKSGGELRYLDVDHRTLKSHGFLKSNRLFVECEESEDTYVPFSQSLFYQVLDRFENTICIYIAIPSEEEVKYFVQSQQSTIALRERALNPDDDNDKDNFTGHDSDEGIEDFRGDSSRTSSVLGENGNSDKNTISSVDSDNCDVGDGDKPHFRANDEVEENWDLDDPVDEDTTQRLSSGDEEYRAYCRVQWSDEIGDNGQRFLTVFVDKRITLGGLKQEMEKYVGTESENFKVFRVYSNNQEYETTRLNDTLASFGDESRLSLKLGRALKKGEYRVKVFQLQVNEAEQSKFLLETVISKGMSVLDSKKIILAELRSLGVEIPLERCRLRKKTWKSPGTIYLDSQLYETDISVFANWEIFLEALAEPEPLTSQTQIAIFVRRWRPSKYELEPFDEVILDTTSVDEFKERISEISDIPFENVEFCKCRSSFPSDISVLEIHFDLEWNPPVSSLNSVPLYICDDGSVLFYRDKFEPLAELSDDERKELQQKENIRLCRISSKSSYSPRKERALKIYTEDKQSLRTNSPDLD